MKARQRHRRGAIAALSLERQLVYDYLDRTGAKPLGNLRP